MSPEVTLLGVEPGEVSAIGGGLTLRLGVHPTPFGQALLAVSERGISSLQFLDAEEELLRLHGARRTHYAAPVQLDPVGQTPREAPLTLGRALGDLERAWPGVPMVEDPEGTAVTLLSVFYAGRGRRPGGRQGQAPSDGSSRRSGPPLPPSSPSTPIPLYVRGTQFQLEVWRALLELLSGEVTTYGGLAGALGRPGAARAVGSAVAANPVAYLIPCHRVVRASGELGGYRWGVERKRAMLEWERAGAAGRG
jgi:AraC family transcriptional regulator, regulatory protein of adaptative response / methylated-DNA-[protein]-cysteine methyltransferase